jgi:hypothetical protein
MSCTPLGTAQRVCWTQYIRSCQPLSLIVSTDSRSDTGCWIPLRRGSVGVQSLNWAFPDAAERRETLFCCYLNFVNAFNSTDHAALWRWLRELKVQDIDLLQSLYSGAY